MSRIQKAFRASGFSAGVALLVGVLAPPSSGFQAPPPAKDGGLGEAAVGCLGHGKGEILLPATGEDGRMSGYLVDCEGVRQFKLEALLTGCIPEGTVGDRFEFGGLYGKVWKLGTVAEPWNGAFATYGIEGTWRLIEETAGVFSAQALQLTSAGRLEVVGELYGKFYADPEQPLGLTFTWSDAAVPGKAIKTRFRDAASQGPDPVLWGDAASAPRKVYPKTPYGEARDKTATQPWNDAARPVKPTVKTRFGDAASQEPDPVLWGDAASVPRKVYPKTPYGEARDKTATQPWNDAARPVKPTVKTRFGDAASHEEILPLQGWFYLRFRFEK